jgi:hypothetical protein
MPAKKKAKKKSAASRTRSTRKKASAARKAKKPAKRLVSKKKASAKRSPSKVTRSATAAGTAATPGGRIGLRKSEFPEAKRQRRSGDLAGDLQGLSNKERADSESVDELLEEGNSFEEGIVSGVERADFEDGEVRTHEVPEDDVPEEYIDEE